MNLYGWLAVRMRWLEDALAEFAKIGSHTIKAVHNEWATVSLLAWSDLGRSRDARRRGCHGGTCACTALVAEHVAKLSILLSSFLQLAFEVLSVSGACQLHLHLSDTIISLHRGHAPVGLLCELALDTSA